MNRFSQICLLLIVLLLAVIAIGPILAPQPIHAAQHKYIAVLGTSSTLVQNQIQTILDKYSADGWEFVEALWPNEQTPILIFQK
jgi:hypothetical protein